MPPRSIISQGASSAICTASSRVGGSCVRYVGRRGNNYSPFSHARNYHCYSTTQTISLANNWSRLGPQQQQQQQQQQHQHHQHHQQQWLQNQPRNLDKLLQQRRTTRRGFRSVVAGLSRTLRPANPSFDPIDAPGNVSPHLPVPAHIVRPAYVGNDDRDLPFEPSTAGAPIPLPDEDIEGVRRASRLAASILQFARTLVADEGGSGSMSTDALDRAVHAEIVRHNAYPSPLKYMGFPKSVCTSVNNVVVHGIPDDRPLVDGDIINVDITVYLDGFHGDTSDTLEVGNGVDERGKALIAAARTCRDAGIAVCAPGVPFAEIGAAIEDALRDTGTGFSICPDFIGHGIGRTFHAPPEVLHWRNRGPHVMEHGHIFTIEPCINEFWGASRVLKDGWTAVTMDGGRSAQAEHTILVTSSTSTPSEPSRGDGDAGGYEILTTL